MANAPKSSKEVLRRRILALRSSLPTDELNRLSMKITGKVVGLAEYKRAKIIASYVAKKDEVQTSYIINHALDNGKRVIVPIANPASRSLAFSEIRSMNELTGGHFGVPEPSPEFLRPVPLRKADLILVPVVAWDEKGFRLGYGHGYFDRALQSARDSFSVGLALELQLAESVPHLDFDMRMRAVVTEKRTLRPHS